MKVANLPAFKVGLALCSPNAHAVARYVVNANRRGGEAFGHSCPERHGEFTFHVLIVTPVIFSTIQRQRSLNGER